MSFVSTVDDVTRGNDASRLVAATRGGAAGMLLGLVAVVASFGAFSVAHAGPVEDARQAQERAAAAVSQAEDAYTAVSAELDALQVEVAKAVEAHNGAQLALAEATAAERSAAKKADQAAAAAAKARDDLGRLVAGVYQHGELTYIGMILNSKDEHGLVNSVVLARSALGSQAVIQSRAALAGDRAASAADAAEDAARARREAAADAEAAVVTAEQAVAEHADRAEQLKAERDQALVALASARETTVERERQRQADVAAQEERERERAAAQDVLASRDAEPDQVAEPNQRVEPDQVTDPASVPEPTSDPEPAKEPEPEPEPEPAAPPGPEPSTGVEAVIAYAEQQLGRPYAWGASGPDAFDCSGLTMMAWSQAGVSLPHWSVAQARAVTRVSYGEIQRGDLIFWSDDGSAEGVYHVGLYVGSGQMIHAPSPGSSVEVQNVFYWRQPAFYGRPTT